MKRLSVDFYDKNRASVSISSDRTEARAEIQELDDALLFACYGLRQLKNLGNHPSARALADELALWDTAFHLSALESVAQENGALQAFPSHVIMGASLDIGMDFEAADRKYGSPIYLVNSEGKGKPRFAARMKFKGDRPLFWLDAKGFGLGGLLGVNIPQYATDSVILVLAHLTKTYSSQPDFLRGLSLVAQDCARVYQAGRIGSINQELIAMEFVSERFSVPTIGQSGGDPASPADNGDVS